MGWIADLLKEIPSAARYKAELETMEKENRILNQKVITLESDNKQLRQEIQRRDDIIQNKKSHDNFLKMKWGCLTFPGDEHLYCQKCYFDKSRKIPTTRKNIKLRFCPVCQKDIPSG